MNKLISSVIACLCASASLAAPHHHFTKEQDKKMINMLIRANTGDGTPAKSTAAKTTDIAERLIAQSEYLSYTYSDTGISLVPSIFDSMHYVYAGGRGSQFNLNYLSYNTFYELDAVYPLGITGYFIYAHHNGNPDVLCDSTGLYATDPFTFAFGKYDNRYIVYDANSNITEYTDKFVDPTEYNDETRINTFDINNNISSSLYLDHDPTFTSDSVERRLFTYNTAHQLLGDSAFVYDAGTWIPEEKWAYTYNSAGNTTEADSWLYDVSSDTWTPSDKYTLAYYPDNKLQIITESSYTISSSWQTVQVDTFGYTTGYNFFTYNLERQYEDGDIYDISWTTRHISAAGLPDTLYTAETDQFGDYLAKNYIALVYDAYNEPVTEFTYPFNFDASMVTGAYSDTAQIMDYYYYETYTKTTGVNNIAVQPTVVVYPNPVADQLHIAADITSGTPISLRLINAGGQNVILKNIEWMGNTETLSLNGLVPGMYWLIITDASGNILHKQAVVKL